MQVSRNAKCVNMEEPSLCPEGERIFFDMFGLERCGCEEGRGRINSTCQSLHYRGECGEGEVVMEAEDAAMVLGTKSKCARGSTCKKKTECSAYLKDIKNMKGKWEDKLVTEYMGQLSCKLDHFSFAWSLDTMSAGICCPDNNEDSLLTTETILHQIDSEPSAACVASPCAEGVEVVMEGSEVICKETPNDLEARMLLPKGSYCRRRQVWSERRQRCVRVFVG